MRRKRILELAKGFFGRKKNVWTVAKTLSKKAWCTLTATARPRRGIFVHCGSSVINAVPVCHDMSYSEFMGKLKKQTSP